MPSILFCPHTVNPNVMLSNLLTNNPDTVTDDILDRLIYLITLMKVNDRQEHHTSPGCITEFYEQTLEPSCAGQEQGNLSRECELPLLFAGMRLKLGQDKIVQWLQEHLAEASVRGVAPTALELAGDFEDKFGYEVRPSQLFHFDKLEVMYGVFFPLCDNSDCNSTLPLKHLGEHKKITKPSLERKEVGMVLRHLANRWNMLATTRIRQIMSFHLRELGHLTFSLWLEAARYYTSRITLIVLMLSVLLRR